MDSITHIVLGATIGDALLGRRMGKKAMLLGAVAQSLPDIDFVASSWLDTSHDVAAHRGITHSLLFVVVVGMLLAWVAERRWRSVGRGGEGLGVGAGPIGTAGVGISLRRWAFFFILQLGIHLF